MRKNQYYENLIKTVIDLSESDVWDVAVTEWEIVGCEVDGSMSNSCVCGKESLKYLFTIINTKNKQTLFPIGSTCINKFERKDLDYEISVYESMFKLIKAVENKEFIELNSDYFSRNLLKYLYEHDVFEANQYNDYDAEVDYKFMLDMFNKRNKDEIYDAQQRKIKAIIISEIIPFIKTKITIRETEKNPIETVCPKCGGKLVLRTSKKGTSAGTQFFGCSNFPECKYTRDIKND